MLKRVAVEKEKKQVIKKMIQRGPSEKLSQITPELIRKTALQLYRERGILALEFYSTNIKDLRMSNDGRFAIHLLQGEKCWRMIHFIRKFNVDNKNTIKIDSNNNLVLENGEFFEVFDFSFKTINGMVKSPDEAMQEMKVKVRNILADEFEILLEKQKKREAEEADREEAARLKRLENDEKLKEAQPDFLEELEPEMERAEIVKIIKVEEKKVEIKEITPIQPLQKVNSLSSLNRLPAIKNLLQRDKLAPPVQVAQVVEEVKKAEPKPIMKIQPLQLKLKGK